MNYFTSACSALVISAHAFPATAQTDLGKIVIRTTRLEQSTGALMVEPLSFNLTLITRQEQYK